MLVAVENSTDANENGSNSKNSIDTKYHTIFHVHIWIKETLVNYLMDMVINFINTTPFICISAIGSKHSLDSIINSSVFRKLQVWAPVVFKTIFQYSFLHGLTKNKIIVWPHKNTFDSLQTQSLPFWISCVRIGDF